MSLTIEELTERLRHALMHNPASVGSLKFSLKGAGFIRAEGSTVTNDNAPADCTLVISKEDLDAVVGGALDVETAMMDGRLELLGDIGVASTLEPTIMAAWSR